MKPRRKNNENLYFFNLPVHQLSGNERDCLSYIRSVARWFAVRRRYEHHIEYIFIADTTIETYLAIAYNIREDSQIEIPT